MEGEKNHIERMADTSYLSEIDRQTISEDVRYLQEISERHPTIFLRPDNRASMRHTQRVEANAEGVSYLGLITQYGSHATHTPPVHLEPRIPIRILSREAKRIEQITPAEFARMYQSIYSVPSATAYMRQKYPGRIFTPRSIVTLFGIEYVEE